MWGIWHVWEKGHVHTGFWWESQRDRHHLEGRHVEERIILKWTFKK